MPMDCESLTVITFHMKINDMYSSSSFRSWIYPFLVSPFVLILIWNYFDFVCYISLLFLFFMPKMKAFAQAKSHF